MEKSTSPAREALYLPLTIVEIPTGDGVIKRDKNIMYAQAEEIRLRCKRVAEGQELEDDRTELISAGRMFERFPGRVVETLKEGRKRINLDSLFLMDLMNTAQEIVQPIGKRKTISSYQYLYTTLQLAEKRNFFDSHARACEYFLERVANQILQLTRPIYLREQTP